MFLLTVMLTLHAAAQNSVDRMVDEFQTVGEARFTSAIERNPQTREVVKVVKTLKVGMPNSKQLREGFIKESNRHDTSFRGDGETKTLIFSEEQKGNARVYMLKYDEYNSEVTIIVNRKKK